MPNTLEVLAQLFERRRRANDDHADIPLALIAVLPNKDGAAAQEIIRSLPSIDFSGALWSDSKEAASSYIIRSLATGSRTIVNYNDLHEMTESDFPNAIRRLPQFLSERPLFHFEV